MSFASVRPQQYQSTQLYTVKETSKLLKVSERSVRRWIAHGDIPVVRLGRSVRIAPDQLDNFINLTNSNKNNQLNNSESTTS